MVSADPRDMHHMAEMLDLERQISLWTVLELSKVEDHSNIKMLCRERNFHQSTQRVPSAGERRHKRENVADLRPQRR